MIQWFIDFLEAETYLEIGVRNGDSFLHVRCKNKIGVDIHFPVQFSDGTLYEMSSDEYFKNHASPFDVAFIDGDHTYEQSLKDVLHCLGCMRAGGVILLHDCNPKQPEWATPTFVEASPDWCGEVWKTIVDLRTRPDLEVFVIDEGFGMGIVRRGWNPNPLPYSEKQIQAMTYKDLDENRDSFLNLVRKFG